MKVIEVIPIARGIGKETLTYFTSSQPKIGSIIPAVLRGKKIRGVVISSEDASARRAELRDSPFVIKKAGDEKSLKQFFLPEFLTAASDTAKYFAGTVGGALHLLVPKIILDNIDELDGADTGADSGGDDAVEDSGAKNSAKTAGKTTSHHVLILQAEDSERIANYKSIVREEFARGRSVFICAPTTADAIRIKSHLDRGIEDYSHIFHGQLRKKNLIEAWNKALDHKHPMLIVATGSFLCLPRRDIGTILVERECSRGYKMQTRPFIDVRMFVEILAKKINARLIYGDTLLRTETIWRYKQDEIHELSPLAFRSTTSARQQIIDARTSATDRTIRVDTLSHTLADIIEKSNERNEHTFLFAARRGLSPLTLCQDCGSIVSCKNCRAPIVLHSKSTERFFLCHHCGERRSAEEKCKNCTSWRLRSFGVGIELVADEIKSRFPDVNLFRIDSDTVKTNARATAIAKKFKEKPGAVLLGTEMAIGYLDMPIENTAVVSLDSMFSIPDFRINEKILSTLLKLRGLATKQFLIQTRDPKNRLFEYALAGNLLDFYKEELTERERFDYPPLVVLIKISFTGTPKQVKDEMEKLKNIFANYAAENYQASTPARRGAYTEHLLIKIGRTRWIDEELLHLLKSLPPQFTIEVEPESVM
ncbi:MAG: primosomal protein N' [Patescibacteria group bacterium]